MLKQEKLLRIYRSNPEIYASQVLGVEWWAKQTEIAQSLIEYKRVLVKACHSIGKSHLGGGIVNWHYDCFAPGITITTAPTKLQVDDILWKEVRVQRKNRPGLQPKASRMEDAEDHFAVGYTASNPDSFQGRHEKKVLIVFDEAVGVDAAFWDAAEGMMTGDDCYWLAICNPTDTSSRAFEEEQKGKFHVIQVSALEHPNIDLELNGLLPKFPAAVRLGWVNDRVKEWCEPVAQGDDRPGDIEWPPNSGKWHRPGALAESRMLGRWPSQGSMSVWSEAAWSATLVKLDVPKEPLEIGCDVARFGDDFTTMVIRRGPCALHHETHNGWDTAQTAGRLKVLCKQFAEIGEDPRKVKVKIDDDGIGGAVVDQRDGFNFCRVSASSQAFDKEGYPNRRSELWFSVMERAMDRRLDLTRLSADSKALLRRQAMAPRWAMDNQGRRVVEKKEETKKRMSRSPDDMDGLNLAFAPAKEFKVFI